jgi:uncharacterized protein (UPF0332 family)
MDSIEKIRQFRAEQSHEKMVLSRNLLQKGDYLNALIQAYLSIFYSVRLLLLDDSNDSDDFNRIIELSKRYYNPTGWISLNMSELLAEGRDLHNLTRSAYRINVSETEAEKFVVSSEKLYNEIVLSKARCTTPL